MKLINMTDYVLEQSKRYFDGHIVLSQYEELTRSYANFIKQPLALWMFVPCDEKGNVLQEPVFNDSYPSNQNECEQYLEAKERCLFEGFTQNKEDGHLYHEGKLFWIGTLSDNIIESISFARNEIYLTETALKTL